MKNLLLYVSDDAGMESRLQVAFDLARAFDAHLQCLQVTPLEAGFAADPFGNVQLIGSDLDARHRKARAFRAPIEARLLAEGINWDWASEDGGVADMIAAHSRLADLVILSVGSTKPAQSLAGEVSLCGGGPVLAIPEKVESLDCFGNAMVAWNGSQEAAHALRLALPMLRAAACVHLVTVVEEAAGFPPVDASQYLARHAIKSELHEWPAAGQPVAAALGDAAARLGAAYLVTGAYGHSRLREAVFGGVTRSLLAESRVPLLLGH